MRVLTAREGEEILDAEEATQSADRMSKTDRQQVAGCRCHLRDADAMLTAGKTIGQACQTADRMSEEISEQTFHRWRTQYGGMKSEEAKRLKLLEEENKRRTSCPAEASAGRSGVG